MEIQATQTSILDDNLFEKINEVIDLFPPSSDEQTMLYDHNKLLIILMEQEVGKLDSDRELIQKSSFLGQQFGRITSMLGKNMDEALSEYKRVESETEKELSGNIYLFAKQWGLSVKALYYYRKGDYDSALALTIECIALNEYLINQGISSLIFRCAEQNRNISKIFLKKGMLEKGALLAGGVLNYLLNGHDTALFGKVFTKDIWNAIPYVREGYAYSYFRGLVFMIVDEKIPRDERNKLYKYMFSELTFTTNTIDRIIIYNWIYLKRLEVEKRYDEFVKGFIEFMQEPLCRSYDIVKICLFKDLKHLLEASAYVDKAGLLNKIEYHLTHKMGHKDLNPSSGREPSGATGEFGYIP